MPVVADSRVGYGYATCTLTYAQAWFDNHMLSSRVVVQLQQVSARMSHMLMLGSLAYSVPLIPGEEGKHYITLHYITNTIIINRETLAMLVPARGHDPSEDETSPFTVDDEGGVVTFTDTFRYLGRVLSSDLTDDLDIQQRLRYAAATMGQLKQTLFCSKFALKAMDDRTKGKLYEALVLGILLYGSETWALTTPNRQKLNKFHNSCVRYLCGARRRTHQLRQHTPTMASLFAKLHVHNMDHYLNTRYIRWAGHVARMSENRLPRRMLTAWVDNPRPRGKSHYGYGHWLEKELNAAGVITERCALARGNVPSWMQRTGTRSSILASREHLPS